MRKKADPGKQKVYRLEKSLVDRLEKYSQEVGVFEKKVVTEALNTWLAMKGY